MAIVVGVLVQMTRRLGQARGEGGTGLRWRPVWQAVPPVVATAGRLDALRVVDGRLQISFDCRLVVLEDGQMDEDGVAVALVPSRRRWLGVDEDR
jgi:hypothetical protein